MTLILRKEPNLSAKRLAFPFQRDAVESIEGLEFAAVFHEQGLGKSKIAIDLLLYWLEKRIVDTVVLVAKKGLVANWSTEFAAHSHLKPLILGSDRNKNFIVFNSPTRLILTHYEAIKSEYARMKLFLRTRSVGVILDESTKIKNPDSELTQVFLDLAPLFTRRVIMTGTPVANRPYDLWAQIRFLDGGKAFGDDFQTFKSDLDLTNELAHDEEARERFEAALAKLNDKIASFSVRETKSSGVIELPAKIVTAVPTDWEPRQFDLYEQVRVSLRAVVKREGHLTEDESEETLKRLLRLVQIASNPRLVDEGYTLEPGKFPVLRGLVDDIVAAGEKVIVWTTFTENADWLATKLSDVGSTKIHGKLSIDHRNRAVDVFLKDPECRVLVATPGAAKEGLTLTVANHVVFFDRSFSLDDYLQAQDRIHRVSQIKTCHVYNLLMRDSIDEWVDLLLHAKRLAAQLAQGDITAEFYTSQASYSYGDVIRGILGLDQQE